MGGWERFAPGKVAFFVIYAAFGRGPVERLN